VQVCEATCIVSLKEINFHGKGTFHLHPFENINRLGNIEYVKVFIEVDLIQQTSKAWMLLGYYWLYNCMFLYFTDPIFQYSWISVFL
jgi:hypothetical protein